MAGVVALVGGRRLSGPASRHLQALAVRLVREGHGLVMGCCQGADQAVIEAVLAGRLPPEALRVMAAFGADGRGIGPWSAHTRVAAFAARGGRVCWWAGGGPRVPLSERLRHRTSRVVAEASAGLVAMCPGRGSWRACRLAVGQGRRVVVFAARRHSLGTGEWASLDVGDDWRGGHTWLTNQADFFL